MQPELCRIEVEIKEKLANSDSQNTQDMESFRNFRDERSNVSYSQLVDVYSFAMILFEMLAHEAPWTGVPISTVYRLVVSERRPEIPEEATLQAPGWWLALMHKCWDQNPANRPSFAEICKQINRLNRPLTPELSPNNMSFKKFWFQLGHKETSGSGDVELASTAVDNDAVISV